MNILPAATSATTSQESPKHSADPPATYNRRNHEQRTVDCAASDSNRPSFDYDNKTACTYLGVSPKVLARLRKLELIQATKIGAFWCYKREWLDAYLDSVTIGPAE